MHLIRDLGDDNLILPPTQIFLPPIGAQPEATFAGLIRLEDVLTRLDHHAASREIRAGNHLDQRVRPGIGVADQMLECFT